jgi:hypothetical protein
MDNSPPIPGGMGNQGADRIREKPR